MQNKFLNNFRSRSLFFSTTTTETTILPNLIHKYEALVSEGVLRADASQLQCLERLQELLESLHLYGRKLKSYEEEHAAYQLKRQLAEEELSHHGQHGQQQQNSGGGGTSNSGWNFSQFFNSFNEKEEEQINRISNKETRLVSLLGPPPSAPSAPTGMYLHGSVGSGKTMLLDMLYNAALESQVLPLQRRLHCNAALLELHSRMHTLEKHSFIHAAGNTFDPLGKNAKVARIAHRRLVRERMLTPMEEYEKEIAAGNSSIMLKAARELLLSSSSFFNTSLKNNTSLNKSSSKKNAALLCFDEMQTTDPYNVAALKALTEAALEDGGSIVATSNRAPKELSPHGLHEAMFEHFIETLERGCDVVELSSPEDYRRRVVATTKKEKYYFWPLNANSATQLESAWNSLPGEEITKPIEIPVMFGRTLTVRKHRFFPSSEEEKEEKAAWFDFDELCGQQPPRGPSDYIALASHFKTVFITNVPAMSMRVRDKARRFITLIDEVYNQRGRVVCTAAVELDELFTGKDMNEEPLVDLEGLQFEVGPVVATPQRLAALGGEEERFAFARAVSRLYEMNTSEIYL